jgi:putative endopeptidase
MKSHNASHDTKGSDATGDQGSIGFSTSYMLKETDPFSDFYTYANGKWIMEHPIPEDRSEWGAFSELYELNMKRLRKLLEESQPEMEGRQLADFYGSAMDTGKIEKLKFQPIQNDVSLISSHDLKKTFPSTLARIHSMGIFPFFYVYSQADEKNSSVYALYVYQGGLSLPDREYYLSETFAPLRKEFHDYVQKVFTLYGEDEENSGKYAETIVNMETSMARESRSRVDLRDPEKNYNRMSVQELSEKYPHLGFSTYLNAMGAGDTEYVVVGQPEFLAEIDSLVSRSENSDLALYMKWNVINSSLPYLFKEAEEMHFNMYGRKIRGQPAIEPRWKRAVNIIDACLGESLGKLYVERYFTEDSRQKMAELISDISSVFADRLKSVTWMGNSTRDLALKKFGKLRVKIGNPKKFRDYSSILIKPDDYLGNVRRSASFEMKRQMARVGHSVDPDEWMMTPPTVNAYYSPPDNEIVFPAGILQPPYFDHEIDDAVNYGAVGAVISHEITHGFDDQGRKYDDNGNIRDWWTPEDSRRFEELAQNVVNTYSALEALPGMKVNGRLTLGENIADLGGVSIAFEALQRHLKRHPDRRVNVDGFTPEQRFFLSWAQVWRENIREDELKLRLTMDPHSPNKFRAIVPAVNHPAFPSAFGRETNTFGSGSLQVW